MEDTLIHPRFAEEGKVKYIIVQGDGMADYPVDSLGGKTSSGSRVGTGTTSLSAQEPEEVRPPLPS